MALLNDTAKILAANLRRVLASTGMTHKQLAERAGMQQPRISEILRGEHDSRLGTVQRLAGALGIPFQALLHPVEEESELHPEEIS